MMQMQASQVNKALTLGESYLEEGKYEEAILAFDQVLSIDEKVVAAYEGKGASYLGLDDYVQAEEQLEAAKTIEFSDSGKILMADVYINTQRREDGLKLVDEVIASNPEDTKTVIHLGDFYSQLTEYSEVIEILEKQIALTENQAELKKLYDELIPAYAKAGKTETEILALLERAANATGDETYLTKKPTLGLGNTISNYANGGWAVETPDTDIFGIYTKGIAKYKNDELATIINENSYKKQSLSYSNGWLYYSSAGDGESQGIYRRKLDSPEIQKLYGAKTDFILYDNEIYFALNSSLYKLNPENAASPIKLTDVFTRRLAAIDNNWIYTKSDNEIFRTKIDGSQQEIIFSNDGYIDNLVIDGYYAYFIAQGKIYRTKTDQTETSVLLNPDDYVGSFNINNNKLYFAKSDQSQIIINQYDLNSNTTELIYSIDKERLKQDFGVGEDSNLADPRPLKIMVTSENIYLLSSYNITYCIHVLNKTNKTLKTLDSYLYALN
ncbi:tetratricopeptide repeat protein [Acetobacterium wieringae]|uniref:tetratricopeptide repeat protein n=1 Tax=Acetobacterium wieringae TaxID=52694 RepID=UPI003158F638